MDASLLVDATYRPARGGWLVRALLTLSAAPPPPPPPPAPGAPARVPLTLALVLDRSGSMAGAPLAAARSAAAGLVRRLRPEDVVGVVAYDDRVTTIAEPATGAEQAAVARAIAGIRPGGSTNLSGGWLRGRELVDAARRAYAALGAAADNAPDAGGAPGAARVVLLTDGLANAGIVDPAVLVRMCAAAREAGVTTTTVGFGPDYDEGLLRAMADAGGGNAYYVERADQAADVFAEEVEGLLALDAQNVRVEVRPRVAQGAAAAGPRVAAMRVHHDWPGEHMADGARLELGDLYAREPKAVLVEWLVGADGGGAEGAPPVGVVAELIVDAHVVTPAGGIERVTLTLPVAADAGTAGQAAPEITRTALLLESARARDTALQARDSGDYATGAAVLREAAAAVRDASPDEAADLGAMAAAFEAERVTAADAKYMGQMAYSVVRGKARAQGRLRRE